MKSNQNLKKAQKTKNDEFYTRYEDIAEELPYYKKQLKNKIIYCNCDNPKYSNFYKFFKDNFHEYKLKSLIATYFNPDSYTYKTVFDGNTEIVEPLSSYGDFRSPICVDILQNADIVITNPPFSLFREFVGVLTKYDKQFLIIGNLINAIYSNIFLLFKDNVIKLGYSQRNKNMLFTNTDGESIGIKARWFTNLDVNCDFIQLDLTKQYNINKYPKYFNFDAINVDKVADIPVDYNGIMGVPISFIDKYNPKQFEIIGLGAGKMGEYIGVEKYDRQHQKKTLRDGTVYYIKDNKCIIPYTRILIRKV